MEIEIALKNYRCFGDDQLARFQIGGGWVALLGVNNVGKSALLRFFHDFRHFFARLSEPQGLVLQRQLT